jgi:transposase
MQRLFCLLPSYTICCRSNHHLHTYGDIIYGQYPVFASFLRQYLVPESPFYQISLFWTRTISPFSC